MSAAHDCLGDPEKRAAYDRGDDLDRGFERDGTTQGMPFSERVLRRYFPEDFKYEPFGDPYRAQARLRAREAAADAGAAERRDDSARILFGVLRGLRHGAGRDPSLSKVPDGLSAARSRRRRSIRRRAPTTSMWATATAR